MIFSFNWFHNRTPTYFVSIFDRIPKHCMYQVRKFDEKLLLNSWCDNILSCLYCFLLKNVFFFACAPNLHNVAPSHQAIPATIWSTRLPTIMRHYRHRRINASSQNLCGNKGERNSRATKSLRQKTTKFMWAARQTLNVWGNVTSCQTLQV